MNKLTAVLLTSVLVLRSVVISGADLASASRASTDVDDSIAKRFTPTIPKVWDDAMVSSLELPLVEPAYSPKHITANYYYKIPITPIYRSYPVYRPDAKPPGYFESLLQREPEIVWNDLGHRPE